MRDDDGGIAVSPGFVLALTLASIIGLLFHSLFGQRLWQLPVYWLVAVSGFLVGEVAGALLGVAVFRIGTVPVVEGGAGALVALALAWLFTTPAPERTRRGGHARHRAVRRSRVPADRAG